MADDKDKPGIEVKEGKDGADAVIPMELLSDEEQEAVRASQEAAAAKKKEEGEEDDEGAEGESGTVEGEEDTHDDTGKQLTDEQIEERRAARKAERIRRRDTRRQKQSEKDRQLTMLQRQNQEMAERLARVENRTSGADMARLDQEMRDAEQAANLADNALSEAVKSGDGEKAKEAINIKTLASNRLHELNRVKQAIVHQSQRKDGPTAPDPIVRQKATAWGAANKWYNPQSNDPDSVVAKSLDEALTREGWDPRSGEYWDELNSRIAKYLPHRVNKGMVRADDDDDDADAGGAPRRNGSKSVATITRGSGKSMGAKGGVQFKLSAERVEAMKESGDWNDPKKRAEMIQYYYRFDKENAPSN